MRSTAGGPASEPFEIVSAAPSVEPSLGAGHCGHWSVCSLAQQLIVEASGAGLVALQHSPGPNGKLQKRRSASSTQVPLEARCVRFRSIVIVQSTLPGGLEMLLIRIHHCTREPGPGVRSKPQSGPPGDLGQLDRL